MEQPHPRVQGPWIARALVAGVLVAVGLVLLDRFFDVPLWTAGVAVFLVVAVGTVHAVLSYRRWGFAIEEDALYLVRGVVTEVETAVPYVRVQHVDTQRGPIERAIGLSSVVVYTAGSRGADITIPGLLPDRAEELRERLRALAGESERSDAV